MTKKRAKAKGRGAGIDPPNRFELRRQTPDWEQIEGDEETLDALDDRPTVYLNDDSQSVVTENNSPDVGFRFSLNPYRGCQHGCSYCYARPTHEYLGHSAGLDFETKIYVKHKAPELLREFLSRESWSPEPIALSGVTDPYQPIERELRITRSCLEVALEARQPMSLITKNALVVRDLDLLAEMATENLVHANISVTTLNAELARSMEPRTSSPAARLRTIQELSAAGVPVRALVAPVIPGLTDSEIPAILSAVREAGAKAAAMVLLRLPLTVAPVFLEWLERRQGQAAKKIEGRIRTMRGGKLNDSQFGRRMRGEGEMADQIRALFRTFAKKHSLDGDLPAYDGSRFRPPQARSGQLTLF